ncbi:hypothetical protein [Nostoc sp.]|uniref:hypothetical protein n=1 Tax=Nostoc sp. TaxID=1180 RepID=UPI002FF8ED36
MIISTSKPKFQQITEKLRRELFTANLTSAEWRFWIYLAVLDPFGNVEMDYDPATIMAECELGKSTYFAIKAKFQKLGWFDFRDGRTKFINLNGCTRQHSGNLDSDSENLDSDSGNLDSDSENLDSDSGNLDSDTYIDRTRDQTIQINSDSDTFSHKSEGEKIFDQNEKASRFGFEITDYSVQPPTTLPKKEATQPTSQTLVKADIARNAPRGYSSVDTFAAVRTDPFFNRRRDPKDISWDWLPDGPWRNEEGKLDAAFWTCIATHWVKEHGGDIHEKKKNVLKHFLKEPANLPIEWEWYQSVTIHKVANIQTRKMHRFDTEGEEQTMMKHTGALKSLPPEMRITATITPDKLLSEIAPYAMPSIDQSQAMPKAAISIPLAGANDLAKDVWDIVAAQTEVWEQKQIAPEGADNPEAYKSVKQVVNEGTRDYWAELDQKRKQPDVFNSATSITATSQPIKEQIRNLAERKSMPRASDQDKEDKTRLSHWNNLLATGLPTVMADAERQALKSGYIIVDGQVVEPEF